jgi:hypothetical protein
MGNLTNQYISASFDGLLQIDTNNIVTNGLGTIPNKFILSSVTASNLSVTGSVSSNLIPTNNNASDLGSTTKAWANIYGASISGTFTGDGSGLTGVVASATPAGPTTSVQFKDGASTSGSSDFTFNKSTGGVTATSFSGSFSGSFAGNGSGLTNVVADSVSYSNITSKPTLLSGSAQIATDISGSFTNVSSSITTRIATLESKTVYSGSFSGSFEGDGSGLTGLNVSGFPYAGIARISGSLIVSGSITNQVLIQTDTTSSTVVPRTTATFDLGSETLKYRNAYFSGHVTASSGQFGSLLASGSSVIISGSLVLPTGSTLTFNNITDKEIVFASGSELESVSNLKWDYTTNTGHVTGSWIVSGSSTLKSIGKFVSNGTTEVSGTLSATGSTWDLLNVTVVSMSTVTATTYYGDGSNLTNVVADSIGWSSISGKPTVLSSSVQIASDVSGSFTATSASIATNIATNATNITTNTSNISTLTNKTGSYATTGSVTFTGQVTATGFSGSFSGSYVGDGSGLTGITSEWDGTLNSNAQITGSLIVTAGVSGSFSGSFTGTIIGGTETAETATLALSVSGSGGRVLFNEADNTTTTSENLEFDGTNLTVGGQLNASTKSFVIKHQTQPGKKLMYGVSEGPEHSVFIRGKLDDDNVIHLPEEWEWLVDLDSITVQLTPIGKHQKLYIEDIDGLEVKIGNENLMSKSVKCFYLVHGTRKDVAPLQTVI